MELLTCPRCTAPLSPPAPGATSLSCTYCQVIYRVVASPGAPPVLAIAPPVSADFPRLVGEARALAMRMRGEMLRQKQDPVAQSMPAMIGAAHAKLEARLNRVEAAIANHDEVDLADSVHRMQMMAEMFR